SAGVVHPSVRHKVGTCIARFRPALVNNVRKGVSISIGFENAFATPEIREINQVGNLARVRQPSCQTECWHVYLSEQDRS
ncbi:MAG: hypothetical protein DMG51_09250, partial [Acidobacteria bacterium]